MSKNDLKKCNCNNLKIDLIDKIIKSKYEDLINNKIFLQTEINDKNNQEDNKTLLSGNIFRDLPLRLYNVTDSTTTEEIPRDIAINFVEAFEINFREYLIPLRIHLKLLKKWFLSDTIDVYLTQNGRSIIFYVMKDDIFYQINDTTNDNNVITPDDMKDYSRQYESIFGKQIDGYIRGVRADRSFKNTRKFEIGKVIFEQFEEKFKDEQDACIFCIPALIMDDKDPEYKDRVTFVLAAGKYSVQESVYKIISDKILYDRNGLCPPGC